MHHVVFITYPGFELLDVSGPASVFNGANHALGRQGRSAFYKVGLVSAKGGGIESSSGIVVDTMPIADLRPGDNQQKGDDQTILVAGAERAPLLAALADPALRSALPACVATAGRFGSVCSGGFLLATLGLLDGHRVASHWDACKPLAESFPAVTVDPDALYVVDGRLWTSAGVTTGIDMALAMIACDLDRMIAGDVAKRLILYARRPGYQSQFSPVLQAQVRGDSPFAELIGWIQANLDAPLDVPSLAERAGLSERSFHRKFVAATGETPARFVETVRLDTARLLLSRGLPLKLVAAKVGLTPVARLSDAFGRRFGMAPRLFRYMHAGTPGHDVAS
ncbi:GlxA family transcriptional regulator [Tistrella mobilis]|uniref:Transcriptional regulator, AraC family n=1 Tax=Tistrella mobilis (strain KA081020-065) TaxID=1110502 RepID=I3TXR9_TISMK|nr:helix-turn-helix domain-containing protein [Tistrella mobilis]AFK57557.1 transcriptional regulator, AraC family [Tistrella mobilis KA081020-065]